MLRLREAGSDTPRVVQRVELRPGINHVALNIANAAAGVRRYEANLILRDDPVPENNFARAAVSVIGPPKVLVLNDGGIPTALSRALRAGGLDVHTIDGGKDLTPARLAPFSLVALENLSIEKWKKESEQALDQYVRVMGGGLLVAGEEPTA